MSLTIVTVTLNNLDGLRQTMASMAAQRVPPDEHWIIDGGSTDGTGEFLTGLPPRPGFHFLSEQDRGIYDAMNKGVARATGDFVWFLNAGDTCADFETVARLQAALRDHPGADGFYGKVWFQGRHGRRSVGSPVRARDFRAEMPVNHQAILYRRALLLEVPYPTDYRLISDWIVTRTLFARGACFHYLDFHFAVYDLGGASTRDHFRMTREKLRHERSRTGRLHILAVCGGRALALWVAHQTGLYHLYKTLQHRPRAGAEPRS